MADTATPRLMRDGLPESNTTQSPAQASGFFASPLGMAIIIPLLVACSAGAVLWICQSLMRTNAIDQARLTFQTQTRTTQVRVEEVLGQADPLLGLMRVRFAAQELPTLGSPGDAVLATWLMEAMRGRPGVAQSYIADGSGHFASAFREGSGWGYSRVRPVGDRFERTVWHIREDGTLIPVATEPDSGFDARSRPWFRLATTSGPMVWTEVYRFARSGRPGITCAQRRAGGIAASMVFGVDFDLESLGSVLAPTLGQPGQHVLFTRDRSILYAPSDWLASATAAKIQTAADLTVEAPRLLLDRLDRLPEPGRAAADLRLTTDDDRYFAAVTAIPVPSGPTWYLGTVVSETAIFGSSRKALTTSLFAGLASVVAGTLAAAFFAGHLARSRRETATQRARAKAAEAAMQEIGSYKMLKLLGKGGMGEVWLAEHRFLARRSAIKRILPDATHDRAAAEEAKLRFVQEARVTAALRCRNTIELYDYGIASDGSFYFVMELLDGCDVRALVSRGGPLPAGRVIHLLRQACFSLAEAHSRGLVHRDIKAENLYVCRRAEELDILKVLDFGIATIVSRKVGTNLTQAGMVQGTPTTMAPEQARGETLDGRSDIYALGCVAYLMITGHDPFEGEDVYSIITMHLRDEPVGISQRLGREVPPGLERIILQCMAKEPQDRPKDALALAEALDDVAIPTVDVWTTSRAKAWWLQHLPAGSESGSIPLSEAPTGAF